MHKATLARCCEWGAVALIVACGGERSDEASPAAADTVAVESIPVPVLPATLDTVGQTFVAWAIDALAFVDTNASVAQWRARHPRDSVTRFWRRETRRFPNASSDAFPLGAWCARATARATLGGGPTALRRVYFYPAQLAPRAELPAADEAQRFVSNECRVGLVFIQLLEADAERGRGLAWVLRRDLEQRYDTGAAPAIESHAFSPPRGKAWLVGPRGLGVSYLPFAGTTSRGAGKVADANTPDEDWRGVVGVAYRSHPSIGDERLTRLDDEDSLPMHDPAVMLRLGVETAALDAAAAAPLRALLASVSVAEPPRSPQGRFAIDSFAPLAPWLAAAVGLPPQRQAGALFAADVVLRLASQRGLLPVDSVSRARFEALGADFVFGRDRQYAYGGAFRRRAFELHAPGVLGDTLFAMYIQRARPCMALGRIIDEAERRLGITRASATRAAVHLVAARALADSFVYTGSATLRERALVHYQAALQEAPQGHDVLRRAWQEGWRLAVGLAPLRLRYYCSRPD